MCIEMAEGEPPHLDDKPLVAMNKISASTRSPQLQGAEQYTATFRDFMSCCTAVDAVTRSTAEELLLHPFLACRCHTSDIAGMVAEYRRRKDRR